LVNKKVVDLRYSIRTQQRRCTLLCNLEGEGVMPKVRERAELAWLIEVAKEAKLTLDVMQPLYVQFLDHVFPMVERSTKEERDAAYARIFDWLDSLDPETEVTVSEGIRAGQLKEKSRSDRYAVRQFYKGSGLLEHSGKRSEHFVRRQLTNGNGAAPTDTAAAE